MFLGWIGRHKGDPVSVHVCDSCGEEKGGYGRHELREEGWRWHAIPGRKDEFVICGKCEAEYERRRELRAAVEAASS